MTSRWQDIYMHLKTSGISVYSPGQHQGYCTSPYVVVKDAGSSRFDNISSMRVLYDVLCYVPKDEFSTLEPFIAQVKGVMSGLYPMIIPMDFQTPSFLDDTVKAYMVAIQYRNAQKL